MMKVFLAAVGVVVVLVVATAAPSISRYCRIRDM